MENLNFGYILKTLRIEAGISLRELARTIDVSPSYLSMIENGKQPPPTVIRIAQLEKALTVPPGYLQSICQGFSPDLVSFVQQVPEARDFLQVAKVKAMTSADFRELTSFLNSFGCEGFKRALERASLGYAESAREGHDKAGTGLYVWPFLSEELIFDVTGTNDKSLFLRQAVTQIASTNSVLNPDRLLDVLLDREQIASTGIGHGVAVPHAYAAGLDSTIMALFRIPEGMDYDTIDGKPVYIAFFSIAPPSASELHLKLLARIARLVSHDTFYRSVLEASSPQEIISVFKATEAGIP